jgi:NAD(P)-dependent dehydrogenase (short-subunit alcohol dehydrogenase family)
LVTGGSRGIGAGIARRLGRDGATVAVNFRDNADAAQEVVRDIREAGGCASEYCASIDDDSAVEQMVGAVTDQLGPVDLLVSNAGTASRGRTIAEGELGEFADLMTVHAWGPLGLVKRLLPGLRQADREDIVVVSSSTVGQAPPNSGPYTMAKAAMEMAARTLAREERRYGIRVNVVAPGLVATDMGARLIRATRPGLNMDDLSLDPWMN